MVEGLPDNCRLAESRIIEPSQKEFGDRLGRLDPTSRKSPVALQYQMFYLRLRGELLPPVLPIFRSQAHQSLPLPLFFDSPQDLAENWILGAEPDVIAVQEDSTGADERCQLAQQSSQLRGVKPVKRSRAENGIHR